MTEASKTYGQHEEFLAILRNNFSDLDEKKSRKVDPDSYKEFVNSFDKLCIKNKTFKDGLFEVLSYHRDVGGANINSLAGDIQYFSNKLSSLNTVFANLNHEAVSKHIRSDSKEAKTPGFYATLFMYMLATALLKGNSVFESLKLGHGLQVLELLGQAVKKVSSQSVGEPVEKLCGAALYDVFSQFSNDLESKNSTVFSHNGANMALRKKDLWPKIFQLDDFDNSTLWKIFGYDKAPSDEPKTKESEERHYVTYRFGSREEKIEIIKSFMVFQSPGKIRSGVGKGEYRNYFAYKVFAPTNRYDVEHKTGLIRRSAGAILPLGETFCCLGVSNQVNAEDLAAKDVLEPQTDIRGSKVITFRRSNFQLNHINVLDGQMQTINSGNKPICSNICCVKAKYETFQETNIGIFELDDADNLFTGNPKNKNVEDNELGNFTFYGEDSIYENDPIKRDAEWKKILDKLKTFDQRKAFTTLW